MKKQFIFIFSQFVLIIVDQCIGPPLADPLLLVKINNQFQFPYVKQLYEMKQSGLPPLRMYSFCPRIPENQQQNEHNLYIMDKQKCQFTPKPTMLKVINANEIYNSWNGEIMDWYVNGFKIYTKEIRENENLPHVSKLEYESLEKGFEIVPGLSIYFNKITKTTIAAKYELLPDIVYPTSPETNPVLEYEKTNLLDTSRLNQFFNVQTDGLVTIQGSSDNLMLTSLVPSYHFLIPPRKDLAKIDLNTAITWAKLKDFLSIVDGYLQIVAMKVGKLNVTSGITNFNTKKTTDDKSKHATDGSRDSSEGDENFGSVYETDEGVRVTVYDILWKVVEYKTETDSYGIIVIIRNSISKSNEKICPDICIKNNWLVRVSESNVYCCNLTNDTIKKLNVDFLGLEERNEFDLKLWSVNE